MVPYDFRWVIKISDKIDVGPLETLKKLNVFWEQRTDIIQVSPEYHWADTTWKFWQVNDRLSPIEGALFTTFSDFFDW